MNKRGFTLIELLATVVILCIIFLFSTPRIIGLIRNAESKNKSIIEEKLIVAGKDYVSDYNKNFIQNFINVNDTGCISAEELIDVGLIESDEVYILGSTMYVKVVLEADDKLDYSVCYSNCC